MEFKKQEVAIRASKIMCSHEEDYVRIEIEDPTSGIHFAEIELSFEAFGKMLTGSSVKAPAELRGLAYVGKRREYVAAKALISEDEYNAVIKGVKYDVQKEVLATWLKIKHSRDGWMMDTYLGSQKSIQLDYETRFYTLNYGYFRYVDPA